MSETAKPRTARGKKRVSWLEEYESDASENTADPQIGERSASSYDAPTNAEAIPRVSAPGVPHGDSSQGSVLGRLRANPAPLAFALLTLMVSALFVWFFLLRSGETYTGSDASSAPSGADRVAEDFFPTGEVRDTGVVFDEMRVEDGEATLRGAGLEWSGAVTEKEGAEGETVTLEGPTAAQLERGFDLESSSVETGVYAVAQQSGEVLHVTTHTYLPREQSSEAGEITLGTVHALSDGHFTGYAYYRDERQENSNLVTRTYVVPGRESYRVSYEAKPGTFVPLLVGWQGFGEKSPQKRPQEGG